MNQNAKATLEKVGKLFDEQVQMLAFSKSFHDYHSKYDGVVHRSHDSLVYAVALRKYKIDIQRADRIIDAVLKLQDLREDSPYFGLWPWYLEESIDEMSPPDFNYADFCGKELALSVVYGYDKEKVRKALEAASYCIMKRDVQPWYTNICILGAFVTLLIGQIYEDKAVFDYGKKRLKKFMEYNQIDEYNSPTYAKIAIEELTNIKTHIQDAECKAMAEILLDRFWKMVMEHYHPATRQWAGPMARAYTTFLKPEIYDELCMSVYGEEYDSGIVNGSLNFFNTPFTCPEKYRHYFSSIEEPRVIAEQYNGKDIAYTYMTPEYTLGSFSVSDMWNQRRPLIAFWNENGLPCSFVVRLLHDGYDFCAGKLEVKQEKGVAEAQLTILSEGGDRHNDLDRIVDGKIMATDFRLSFVFENTVPQYLKVDEAVYDGKRIQASTTNRTIDYVLHKTEQPEEIDLKSLGRTIFRFTINMEDNTLQI